MLARCPASSKARRRPETIIPRTCAASRKRTSVLAGWTFTSTLCGSAIRFSTAAGWRSRESTSTADDDVFRIVTRTVRALLVTWPIWTVVVRPAVLAAAAALALRPLAQLVYLSSDAVYDWRHPLDASLGVVLMEFGDFAMNRRMMRGIKARAESLVREGGPSDALVEG